MSAGSRQLERAPDRGATVWDQEQVVIALRLPASWAPAAISSRTLISSFVARIVVREHHDARSLAGGAAHHRALGDVARAG